MKKMFSQRLGRPSRHGVQWPHQRDGLTATRSPTFSAGRGAGDLDDLAGDLVAEHQRRGHDEIAGAGVADSNACRSRKCRRRRNGSRTMPEASGSSGRSTMRRSSGPNSVAAKAIDVILTSPMYFGSQSVSAGM